MNKVILIGRLTKDPEISTFGDGLEDKKLCRFMLAINRDFKKDGENTADFINCVTFGSRAEIIQKYCKKGTKIGVSGTWQTGKYTNQNGQTVYTNKCIVNSVEFCEKKPEESTETTYATDYNSLEDDDYLPF